jgi:uncharacterized Tic20 family protein
MSDPAIDHPAPTADHCSSAMLCHLLGLLGLFIPFGNIIGPAVVWALKKREHPLVDDQGKEALNFQITYTLYGLGLFILLAFVLISDPENLVRWGLMLAIVTVFTILYIVLMIMAMVRANSGQYYRYPLTLRFLP